MQSDAIQLTMRREKQGRRGRNFATLYLIVLNQVSRRPKSRGVVRSVLFGMTPTVSIFPQYGDRFRQRSQTHHQIPVTVNSVRYG